MKHFILKVLKLGLVGGIIGALAGGFLFPGGTEFGAMIGFVCAIAMAARQQSLVNRGTHHSAEAMIMQQRLHGSQGWHDGSFGGHDVGGFDGGGFDGGGGDAGGV